jgi:hypothetical protein
MSPDGILHEEMQFGCLVARKIEHEKSRTQIFSSIPSRCVSLDYNLPSVTPTREGSHLTSTFLTNPSSSSFLSPTLSVPSFRRLGKHKLLNRQQGFGFRFGSTWIANFEGYIAVLVCKESSP